jgi:hypothetical protein
VFSGVCCYALLHVGHVACFTVVAQLVHFAVVAQAELVGQLVHFAVVAQAELVGQLVHCALTVAAQLVPAAVPHVFVAHVAVVCAVTLVAVKSERAASTTRIDITVFFIQVLLSSFGRGSALCLSFFFPPYKYILQKILVSNKTFSSL